MWPVSHGVRCYCCSESEVDGFLLPSLQGEHEWPLHVSRLHRSSYHFRSAVAVRRCSCFNVYIFIICRAMCVLLWLLTPPPRCLCFLRVRQTAVLTITTQGRSSPTTISTSTGAAQACRRCSDFTPRAAGQVCYQNAFLHHAVRCQHLLVCLLAVRV